MSKCVCIYICAYIHKRVCVLYTNVIWWRGAQTPTNILPYGPIPSGCRGGPIRRGSWSLSGSTDGGGRTGSSRLSALVGASIGLGG